MQQSFGAPQKVPIILLKLVVSVLMKVLYAARMARFELVKAMCSFACFVTRWDESRGRHRHRP
eukprot:8149096-Lingulodinium_polyedra.AAC.1